MSTMINAKYEGDKVAYLDNEFIRKSPFSFRFSPELKMPILLVFMLVWGTLKNATEKFL